MKARVVVFPISGRNWCFSRSIEPASSIAAQSPSRTIEPSPSTAAQSSTVPSTFKQLYYRMRTLPTQESKVELVVDFASHKMNEGWRNLERAPRGTVKNKIHGLGLLMLSRVKPSEIFLKSISKEVDTVDMIYPSGMNPRLVRRRLRHVALRGSAIHEKYMYGYAILVPLSSFLTPLPGPNVVLFWVMFRAYSHWRASQGCEKLLELLSDDHKKSTADDSDDDDDNSTSAATSPLVLHPSEELKKLLQEKDDSGGLGDDALSMICERYSLNSRDVAKYRNSL